MTTFSSPLFITGWQQTTGNPETDAAIAVAGLKEVELSAGGKQVTRAVPPNSTLFDANVIVSGVPASVTQGLIVRIGTSATPMAYGVINAVTNGFFRVSLNPSNFAPVSGAVVVFDVTASVSAAEFNAGHLRLRTLWVPRG